MSNPEELGELLKEAVATAREFPRPEIIDIEDPRDGTQAIVALTSNGFVPVDAAVFDKWRIDPLVRKGTADITTVDSFIALVNRFKQDNSAIFALDDPQEARLTAIFDYHPAVTDAQDEARNLRHRAIYNFPLSDEWKAWSGKDGEVMSMTDFAAFLEDRIVDVVTDAEPTSDAAKAFVAAINGRMATPTKLIELARGLQVYENSVLKEARNLSSGEGQLTFDSQHVDADGKPLQVPNLFMICVPIFARSPDFYRLLARLRYRKTQGGLAFWFELWRADMAFEQAFTDACAKVAEATALPLFTGTAEL